MLLHSHKEGRHVKIRCDEATTYAFDNRDEPVLRIQAGEVFSVETEDALSGLIEIDLVVVSRTHWKNQNSQIAELGLLRS